MPGIQGTGRFNLGGGTLVATTSFGINQAIALTGSGGNGNINTNGNSLVLLGQLSGSGGLNKLGAGVLVLEANEIYTGGTTISAGTLQIGYGAPQGNLIGAVTNNATLAFEYLVNNTFAGCISGTGTLVQEGPGILTLGSSNTYAGITFASARIALNNVNAVQYSTVNVSSNGNLLFNTTNGAITTFNVGGLSGNGNITLADGSHPLTINVGGNGSGTTYGGALSSSGGLTKTGSGTLTLTGLNTYTGATTLAGGELSISASSNLGVPGHQVVFNGGVLQVTGTALKNIGNDSVNWSSFNGGFDIVSAANVFTVGNSMSGTGGLAKLGPGKLVLTTSNAYNGGTAVSGGTLTLAAAGALPSGMAVLDNGTLDLATFGATVSALSGTGVVNHSGAGSATLTLGGGSAIGDFAGTIENTGGTLAVLKIGGGQLILSGSDSYGGGTTVSAGTLIVNNGTAITDQTALIVGAGGTFVFDPSVSGAAAAEAPQPIAGASPVESVPEPGALALLSLAALMAAGAWRRRRTGD